MPKNYTEKMRVDIKFRDLARRVKKENGLVSEREATRVIADDWFKLEVLKERRKKRGKKKNDFEFPFGI